MKKSKIFALAVILFSSFLPAAGLSATEAGNHGGISGGQAAELTRSDGRVCGTPMLRDHYEIAAALRPERDGKRDGHDYIVSSKPKNKVGDQRTFWTYDLSVMPPTWIQVPSTCRGVGMHCYVFVADDQWEVNMDQADVAEVLYRFNTSTPGTPDKGIFTMDVDLFGPTPDELDEDPRIYIFYSALGSYGGSIFDGYFDPLNELTEEEAQLHGGHSNEVEMFYMSCYPVNPTAPSTLSVLAHEFQHMIHWNMDRNEVSWVDEGCAELAMLFYGVPDPITGFPNNPDNSLVEWDQEWADYVKSYLFTLYFYEQYAGEEGVTALVAEPLNSISGYEATLDDLGFPIGFDDIFTGWTAANLLDDTTIGNGEYGYYAEELPSFYSKWHAGYPVTKKSGSTQHWACDYQRFSDPGDLSRAFYFDGADDAEFRAKMVLKGDGVQTEVREIYLFEDMFGTDVVVPGSGYDTPFLIINNCTENLTKSYFYGTDLAVPISSDATDGGIPGEGIDVDDEVIIAFSYPSTKPDIDAASIDSLLDLSGDHTWLDGAGGIGGASWNAEGDTLIVLLSTDGGLPTVAVGDTLISLVDDARASVIIGGSFSQAGFRGEDGSPGVAVRTTLEAAPNPFNPFTLLTFSTGEETDVRLRIFNLSGSLVATLFDGFAAPGNHAVRWEASTLASGVYIAVLVAGGKRTSTRLLLLK